MDAVAAWGILIALAFPIAYGLLILWATKYRFRCTMRNLLIAMTIIALALGLASALIARIR